jgi:hypothetical protein
MQKFKIVDVYALIGCVFLKFEITGKWKLLS